MYQRNYNNYQYAQPQQQNGQQPVQFVTLNVKSLVRQLLHDPHCQKDIEDALNEGPAEKLTDIIGTANLGTPQNPIFCSLFTATDREKDYGQPGLFRRSQNKQDRISLRLRPQLTQQGNGPFQQQVRQYTNYQQPSARQLPQNARQMPAAPVQQAMPVPGWWNPQSR